MVGIVDMNDESEQNDKDNGDDDDVINLMIIKFILNEWW